MKGKGVSLQLDLDGTFSKLVLLHTLILMSVRQKLNPRLTATYSDGFSMRGVKERFSDGISFQRRGWGDCADAIVFAGALLRQRGHKVFPVLAKLWDKRTQCTRYHALLYYPKRNLILDPTFLLFPKFRPYAARYYKTTPTPAEMVGIRRQLTALRKYYGA